MNKKGLEWGYLIAGIIAVIVLIVLVWIFRDTISEAVRPWLDIIKGVSDSGEEISRGIESLG